MGLTRQSEWLLTECPKGVIILTSTANKERNLKAILITALCLSMTACGTIRNDYTVNGQDLNQDHSTAKIVVGVIAAGALVAALSRKSGSCETGPRGGTYTVTASGNKNYAGC